MMGRVLRPTAVFAAVLLAACSADSTGQRATEPAEDGSDRAARELVELEPTAQLTAERERDAEELRRSVLDAVDRHGWRDIDQAAADGFVPMTLDESHWYQPDHVADGRLFDPDAPEFLVVDDRDVIGVMFLAANPGLDQPDPPGAPLVRWHFHEWDEPVCLKAGMIVVGLPDAGRCEPGSTIGERSPLMAHVWLVATDDPFASEMDSHQHP